MFKKSKETINRFNRYSIEAAERFKKRIDNISVSEKSDSEKLADITKLAERQNQLIQNMVNDQDSIFTHIKALDNYKQLAMRGLSFMAGGHELCGIFDTLKYHTKNNISLAFLKKDINRLEDVFVGQMGMAANSDGWKAYSGSEISAHFTVLFKNRDSKKITYSSSFLNYDFNIYMKRSNALTIISNLINNAAYYSDSIHIDYVDNKIIVSDNGRGINDDELSKLFNVGFTTKGHRGHGFGLFLCREIARNSNADLYLDPENKYTTFKGASFVLEILN